MWRWNPGQGPWRKEFGGPKGSVYFEVSCDHVEPRETYDYWREHAFKNFEPDVPSAEQKSNFRAKAKAFYVPRGELFTYQSDAISGRRSRRQARADSGSSIDIGLILSGLRHAEVDDGHDARHSTGAGSFFVYDPMRPIRIHWQTHAGLHLTLRRTDVAAALGGNIPPTHILGNMLNTSRLALYLRMQLRLLAQDLPTLSLVERSYLLNNALDLLFATLRTVSAGDHGADAAPAGEVFAAARRCIESRLSDPNLHADEIAAAIGCSRSTLYRAFAERQLAVADYVREQRFKLFLHLLRQAPEHVTITAIAHRCGFSDVNSFGKAFKQRFGMSPRTARRAATGRL